MKNLKLLSLVVAVAVVSLAYGCAQKPAAVNATEAIEASKTKTTIPEQVNYLADQAKAFINSKNFDQAINVANYILSNLDQNSQVAKDILEQAKAELKKVAESAVSDMKNKLGTLGK